MRYAYPDSNASNNGNIYTDSNSCCHGYGYSYSNSNRYSNRYSYSYSYSYTHTYADTYTESYSASKASPHPTTAAVGIRVLHLTTR